MSLSYSNFLKITAFFYIDDAPAMHRYDKLRSGCNSVLRFQQKLAKVIKCRKLCMKLKIEFKEFNI
jgi:hypothetical protein